MYAVLVSQKYLRWEPSVVFPLLGLLTREIPSKLALIHHHRLIIFFRWRSSGLVAALRCAGRARANIAPETLLAKESRSG
jgi:hypothetical protein